MRDPFVKDLAKMPLIEQDQPVQALSANCANQSFAIRVRLRCSHRCLQNRQTHRRYRGIQAFRIDAVAIAFEACSGFTHVAVRTLAGPPRAGVCPRGFDGSVTLPIARGSYQGVPTPPWAGLSPAALTCLSRHTLLIATIVELLSRQTDSRHPPAQRPARPHAACCPVAASDWSERKDGRLFSAR
jgi:hypothetical protein